jgi:lipopolysaccharide export system protein LptC
MNFSFLSDNLFLRDLKIYAFVALLAAISWGIVEMVRSQHQTHETTVEVVKHSADYFSKDYLRKDLNEQGRLKSELSAQSILHYSDDGTTHIEQPKLTLYNADPAIPPWVVKSETGILSPDGEDLFLKGKVFIDRAKGTGTSQMIIKTSNLRVKPKISYATSEEWAEIISPPHRTESIGIEITFKKPIHIKMLSRVKSRYELH